jgi:hypothetical protein
MIASEQAAAAITVISLDLELVHVVHEMMFDHLTVIVFGCRC